MHVGVSAVRFDVSGRWWEHGAISFIKSDIAGSKIEDRGLPAHTVVSNARNYFGK
jgi:hypothetical protein